MFGCCNNLFSPCCGCNRCGMPAPFPAPQPPVIPAQPAKLRGMQLSLVGSSAGTVDPGAAVPFDTVNLNNTLGVAYTPSSGTVTINRAGTYLVNWWLGVENAQTAASLSFATSAGGSDVQTSYSDIGGGQIFGTAIVNVTSIPTTLQLVNRSAAAVTYATAEIQAGMTIVQYA